MNKILKMTENILLIRSFLYPPLIFFMELLFYFLMFYFFVTGVNSFQVYMAYKDYYQMSNSEVQKL